MPPSWLRSSAQCSRRPAEHVYFTDRGIEELDERRGSDQVALGWLAARLRDFVDEHPDTEAVIDLLASWLARLDDEPDD